MFVVASARDDINPAEILFEFEGVRRDSAPRRETGKVTPTISSSGTGVSRVGFNCEDEWFIEAPIVGALDTECGGTKMNHQTIASGHIFPVNKPAEATWWNGGQIASTITTRSADQDMPDKANFQAVLQPTYAIQGSMIGRNDSAGPQGDGINVEVCFTQNTIDRHAVAQPISIQDVRPVEKAQNGKGWNDDGTAYTVDTHATQGVAQPMAYNIAPGKGELKDDIHITDAHVSKTIDASGSNPAMHQGGAAIVQTMAVAQPVVLMDQGGSVMNIQTDGTVGTLRRETHGHEPAIVQAMAVRRLTPIECERLQGFPDNYSNIPWRKAAESPDGPRYKALGNSWAVPVVAWIGQRIQDQIK